jgi:hypothetical protein
MTDHTDTAHQSWEDEFQALCTDWRLRMLDALHEYRDIISSLENPPLHQSLYAVYGEPFVRVIAELKQSAIRIAAMIDNSPLRASPANVGALTILFADIRNPISSFSILDQVLQALSRTQAIDGTEVQPRVERLLALGRTLAQLLDELLRLRARFSPAT